MVLPALPLGQVVQCPRCRHVFEPRSHPPLPSRIPPRTSPDEARSIEEVGDFVDEPLPPTTYAPLRGEWKAPAAMVALALSVLSFTLQLYINWERSHLGQMEQNLLFHGAVAPAMRAAPQMGLREFEREFLRLSRLSQFAGVIHFIVIWPAVVLTLIWLHQAAWSLRILQTAGLAYSPSQAVLSFFIPIANLYQPYFALQEIWRASDPKAAGNSLSWRKGSQGKLVIVWWLALLAAVFCDLMSATVGDDFQFDGGAPRLLLGSVLKTRMQCAMNIFMILAGTALIAIIDDVRRRQRTRHAIIYDDTY